ncbi:MULTISPECIES: Gfo/Idh/MocA family oxidoreductase [unclassified Paenibacillus]|uniref:Gfo/Idh/MocA family protein n=1 Tax=unclassified Paenibacillus TaxID=185978 RepID=UPI00095600B8|nr:MULTISPECIES: Gfo/Idh/MocA family oxidoreductase [unclassified Paenibacillus]ASS66816.1 Gfo/Idh/MocA family oxidoreductase [Paenibacillus sp. RUD330]SIP94502.1 Predicted dehydrogenase [Paenibacillus sp. RU4X]SIQ12932.1 Predicted dehydrogenase [Paenibacillus sp. RU4T]
MGNNSLSALDLDYKPKVPGNRGMGIAVIGAGEIVGACHLPAYRMGGLNVVGIFDLHRGKAEKLAAEHGLPKVYRCLDELLEDPGVEVVDIAVPAKAQPAIARQAAQAGRHMLCQKPLAESYAEAASIEAACREAGVKGAVNQQMRWSPGIRASRDIIGRGWLGELLQASISVRVRQDFAAWEWLRRMPTLEVMYHSIHYLDAIRFLFGKPEYIYADGARFPGQETIGETRTMLHLKFPGEARGLVHDDHNHIGGEEDWHATFRFDGTEGIIKGTNGSLYNYPTGREDTLSFHSRRLHPDYWFTPSLHGKWFPDAFLGTMCELLRAIEEDREPENSVRDNLETMQLVFGAYRSMAENRPVTLQEIAEEAVDAVEQNTPESVEQIARGNAGKITRENVERDREED